MPNIVPDAGPNNLDLTLASSTGWESPGSLVLPNGDRIQNSTVNASNPGVYIDGATKRFTPDWGVSDWCLEFVLVGPGGGSSSHTGLLASYGDSAGTNFSWSLSYSSTYNLASFIVYLVTGGPYAIGPATQTFNRGSGVPTHLVYNLRSSLGVSALQWQTFNNNVLTTGTGPGGGTPKALGVDWRFRLHNNKNNTTMNDARGKFSVYNRMLTVGEVNNRYLALTSV